MRFVDELNEKSKKYFQLEKDVAHSKAVLIAYEDRWNLWPYDGGSLVRIADRSRKQQNLYWQWKRKEKELGKMFFSIYAISLCNGGLADFDIEPTLADKVHKHLAGWSERACKELYASNDEAVKKLIWSLWLSDELKPFMTLGLASDAIQQALIGHCLAVQTLSFNPFTFSRWVSQKI